MTCLPMVGDGARAHNQTQIHWRCVLTKSDQTATRHTHRLCARTQVRENTLLLCVCTSRGLPVRATDIHRCPLPPSAYIVSGIRAFNPPPPPPPPPTRHVDPSKSMGTSFKNRVPPRPPVGCVVRSDENPRAAVSAFATRHRCALGYVTEAGGWFPCDRMAFPLRARPRFRGPASTRRCTQIIIDLINSRQGTLLAVRLGRSKTNHFPTLRQASDHGRWLRIGRPVLVRLQAQLRDTVAGHGAVGLKLRLQHLRTAPQSRHPIADPHQSRASLTNLCAWVWEDREKGGGSARPMKGGGQAKKMDLVETIARVARNDFEPRERGV